ncbi:L domain-like protein [Neocallimastix lanati (nom. inval.)]|nr:L domain-like protein [Neocallimastix sp. JGI-2020a]
MPSIKNLIFVASVLLLNKNVFANDCSELESAIGYLGSDFKSTYQTNDCCKFNGVICDNNKNVIGIKFNNVKGSQSDVSQVFEKLSNLKQLTSLDLSGNGFSGYIPYSITKLTNLRNLNLSNNKFNGTIPYDTKDLEKLELLNLEGNSNLYGYVPVRNITKCYYKNTNLCNLPNASCKSDSKECTIDDVNKTNEYNGYPTQSSTDRSAADSTARASSAYYDDYVYGGYGNYDNSGYGYTGNNGYGYDNSGYGYSNNGYGYDNSYGNSYGNSYSYPNNFYEDDYGSPFADLFKTFIGLGLFSLLALICCLCCLCRTCCGGSSSTTPIYTTSSSTKPYGLYQTNNTTTVHKPTKPTSTTIHVNNGTNPYVTQTTTTTTGNTQDITNINTHSNYSMPNSYQQTTYPATYNQQYGQPYGYGIKREVEDVKDTKNVKVVKEVKTEVKK